ncbi:hypothetical protein NARC_30091 [Candidatus Nitrosocosmicus arcticus]|uniref:Uncharacterized protein n=1 Tax=Candidatus Nitrosocosmicus arcticus TaxID=2035267 RepID=A0A557SXN9_9ARCH|nr:hypothetical protein NARC_30091 [Candidatus Nitrosocosmicus arcticus]
MFNYWYISYTNNYYNHIYDTGELRLDFEINRHRGHVLDEDISYKIP